VSIDADIIDRAIVSILEHSPQIARGLIKAREASRPVGYRRHELEIAISQARLVLDELLLCQTRLGWHDRGGTS
jgi:hypothetical protein